MSLEYTVLEVIVMIALGIVGAGLLVKRMIFIRLWVLKRADTVRERKVLKAEEMRKIMSECGFPRNTILGESATVLISKGLGI